MSAFPDRAMVEQATAWHLRLQDADDETWIEFAEWLSADPAHNGVYERVVDGDMRMSPLLERASFPLGKQHEAVPEFSHGEDGLAHGAGGEVVRRNYGRWGAVAASVAAVGFMAVQVLPERDVRYSIETAAGELRTVSLADGSEIKLNGNTRIVLDKNDARLVEVARGEARFTVKHDQSDPFTVVAGGHRLVDIGTVFNVVRTSRQFRVGVAEGAVRFEGTARTVNLHAGDSLAADSRGKIELSQSPVASIGSWVGGKLVYDQASLGQVSDDLYRSIGISLALPRRMASRSFSGVIQTNGDTETIRARLEELIGETIVADGTKWSVEAR